MSNKNQGELGPLGQVVIFLGMAVFFCLGCRGKESAGPKPIPDTLPKNAHESRVWQTGGRVDQGSNRPFQ